MNDIISTLTMKELEQMTYRTLQKRFSQVMSPVVQNLAIELDVIGVSYRQASQSIERLLDYPVLSHEAIRQQLLNTEVVPEKAVRLDQDVGVVEVEAAYTRRQEIKGGKSK